MLLKKIKNDWFPAEFPAMKIGDSIEITDYMHLVKTGKAVIIDEETGEEMLPPGSYLTCPICFAKLPGVLAEFTNHVEKIHSPKPKEAEEVDAIPEGLAPAPEAEKELTTQEKRLAALKKAREARAAKAAEGATA